MLQPLVSVVMCTYNGSKFIDEQIESILLQDYPNIELIIVDDLSTDDTWQKLMMWRDKSSNIYIFKNEINIGYNKNFEKAIQLAKGELIAISDQDDIWLPKKVSAQVTSFKEDDVMLSHNKSVRLEDGRLRFKSASLFHHFKGNDTRRLFVFNQINGHDMMFRKELVQKALPIPDGMMYDWWLAVNATCHGNVASVNKYLVHHRIHADNSFFKEEKGKKNRLDMLELLQTFMTMDSLSDKSKLFLTELLSLVKQHNQKGKGFDLDLFLFFYINGKIIFGHKRRWIPQFEYLKSALKYARSYD